MKVLVIPDIHLKPWIFDRASEILKKGKAERAVCLMDIPDDWGMELSVEQYRDTFDRAISFAKTYPETLWCYGNHDVSYPWGKLETGYSPYAERTVISKLDELKDSLQDKSQIAFIHRIENVLFMHGGLTEEYVSRLNPELLDADIDEVLEAANSASGKTTLLDLLGTYSRYGKESGISVQSDVSCVVFDGDDSVAVLY